MGKLTEKVNQERTARLELTGSVEILKAAVENLAQKRQEKEERDQKEKPQAGPSASRVAEPKLQPKTEEQKPVEVIVKQNPAVKATPIARAKEVNPQSGGLAIRVTMVKEEGQTPGEGSRVRKKRCQHMGRRGAVVFKHPARARTDNARNNVSVGWKLEPTFITTTTSIGSKERERILECIP